MSRLAACPQSPRSQNPGAWYKVTYLKYFFWKVFLARIFHFLLQVQFLTSPEKCSEGERRWPRWSENVEQVFVSHANKSWKHPDSQKKKTLPRLSVSSTIATDGDKPGDLSVPRTSSSNRWSKGAVYCLLSSAFYHDKLHFRRVKKLRHLWVEREQQTGCRRTQNIQRKIHSCHRCTQVCPIMRKHRAQLRGISM